MESTRLLQRLIVIVVCVTLAAPGCAAARFSGGAARMPSGQDQPIDPAVLAEYVQKLTPGTTIRVDRAGGRTVRGTLMKASDRSLVIQPKTRIPEPAIEIPLSDVLRVTPEAANGGNLGKAIGIGAAAGAGAALAVFFIIVAVFAD